jgi:inorganic pyrophosphatase
MNTKMKVIIECPKGSQAKYKYNEEKKDFEIDKILPLGMVFPYDFGFIPDTVGEDKDPLDAMVFSEFPLQTGSTIECRLIGGLTARQQEPKEKKPIRNDRFFFVPVNSVNFQHVEKIADFGKTHNQQLQDFFVNYNRAEGKLFEPEKYVEPEKALKLIKNGKR